MTKPKVAFRNFANASKNSVNAFLHLALADTRNSSVLFEDSQSSPVLFPGRNDIKTQMVAVS